LNRKKKQSSYLEYLSNNFENKKITSREKNRSFNQSKISSYSGLYEAGDFISSDEEHEYEESSSSLKSRYNLYFCDLAVILFIIVVSFVWSLKSISTIILKLTN
jgi:hypothetical protein